ncbi:amidohydrolase [Streptomyces sp. NPDC003697]
MHHDNPADLVFTGGPVHTVDPARPRAGAVAVRGDRIVAVGGDEVRDLIGPDTEVVDLKGRLLLPGFQDAHVHPVGAGVEIGQCDLSGVSTADAYAARIRSWADAHPERPWIVGGGWSMEAFDGGVPHRDLLDTLVPDRPVYLVNRDHHGAWVNSVALERAGLTAGSRDPEHGRIERDPDGRPSGVLQESAMALVADHAPAVTAQEQLQGLLRAQEILHGYGITAWQDALLGDHASTADASGAYLRAAREGLLTARVRGALWWEPAQNLEQIDGLLRRREELTCGRFRPGTVKIMQDGIAESGTAAMLEPYLTRCGCASTNTGLSFVDPAELRRIVAELDARDFQVHFHALGDRAVREALDALAHARRVNGPSAGRHHLAHLQVVDRADIGRFRALDATANIQALWAAHEPQMDELTIPFLGERRAARQYPFAELLASGAVLAAGSDWPVSSPDPIAALHTAVNRQAPHSDRPVFLPEQRIPLDAAVRAYTAGSAFVNHLDDTGTIAPGKLADLTVLDRDVFALPAEEIASAAVSQTFVGGRRVYAASDA